VVGEDEKVRLTRIVGRGAMIGDDKRVEQLKLALAHHDKPEFCSIVLVAVLINLLR
jgi:hypothetical protein